MGTYFDDGSYSAVCNVLHKHHTLLYHNVNAVIFV